MVNRHCCCIANAIEVIAITTIGIVIVSRQLRVECGQCLEDVFIIVILIVVFVDRVFVVVNSTINTTIVISTYEPPRPNPM